MTDASAVTYAAYAAVRLPCPLNYAVDRLEIRWANLPVEFAEKDAYFEGGERCFAPCLLKLTGQWQKGLKQN